MAEGVTTVRESPMQPPVAQGSKFDAAVRQQVRRYCVPLLAAAFDDERREARLGELAERVRFWAEAAGDEVCAVPSAGGGRPAPELYETLNLDTEEGEVRARRGLTVKLRREASKKNLLVVRLRSMDPVLARAFGTRMQDNLRGFKKWTARFSQAFHAGFTEYTVTVSRELKQGVSLTSWRQVEKRLPGVCSLVGILNPDSLVVYKASKWVWKARGLQDVSVGSVRAVSLAQLTYRSEEDALAGFHCTSAKFSMRMRNSKHTEGFLQQLRSMYYFFYEQVVRDSLWVYDGPAVKRPTTVRVTREYQIAFDPAQWIDRPQAVDAFHAWLQGLQSSGGFDEVRLDDLPPPRLLEHFSLDSPTLHLKSRERDEVVIKLERNEAEGTAQLTAKYKGFDVQMVRTFPVRVASGYSYSSKLEQDYHPSLARVAISLAATVPIDKTFSAWGEVEAIFPGLMAFTGLDPEWPVVVRLYKAKWEQNRQMLRVNDDTMVGKISLEYPTMEDAVAGTNLFHGQWSYRAKEPSSKGSEPDPSWIALLERAYETYYRHVVPSPFTYLHPAGKPNNMGSQPLLADTSLPHTTTCGLMVLREASGGHEVLVLHHHKRKKYPVDFPKGRLDGGETNELLGALRETEEETGITEKDLHVVPNLKFYAERYRMKNGRAFKRKRFVLFLALLKKGSVHKDVSISDEHTDVEWREWDGVSPLNLGRTLLDQCLIQLAPHIPEYVSSKE